MSSGSSGHYQSRLFNFVHQHSRRLTKQWEHTFRHLQVATKWSVEVLLYPVYLLLHSDESDGKRLNSKEQEPQLNLQPSYTDLPADTPIQNVLEAVQNLSSPEIDVTPATKFKSFNSLGFWRGKFFHHPPTKTISQNPPGNLNPSHSENAIKHNLKVVRGIATNLVSRNLVLVTADNEILDILTPQQQIKLADRIISEIASYWHNWRLSETKKQTQFLPEIDRLLAKLTGQNIENIPELATGIPNDLLKMGKLLEIIDTSLAKLETNALVPVQQRSQEIVQVAQTQLNIFLYGKEQLAMRGEIAVNGDGLETHSLNLQALIEAALNYFFGVGKDKKLGANQEQLLSHHRAATLPKNRDLHNEYLAADPWLNWNDLFGRFETFVDQQNTSSPSTKSTLLPSSPARLSQPKKPTVQQPKTDSGLVKKKLSTTKKSRKVASTKQIETQSTKIEAKPDWIETKATSMGYEKHPLEQLLEWIDRAMLWLEEIFVRFFQSFQRLWVGK
jgi:hypothetical protein